MKKSQKLSLLFSAADIRKASGKARRQYIAKTYCERGSGGPFSAASRMLSKVFHDDPVGFEYPQARIIDAGYGAGGIGYAVVEPFPGAKIGHAFFSLCSGADKPKASVGVALAIHKAVGWAARGTYGAGLFVKLSNYDVDSIAAGMIGVEHQYLYPWETDIKF